MRDGMINALIRNVIAMLAGVIVAMVLIVLLQSVAHSVYPPPPGLDYTNPEVRKTVMMQAPAGALFIVLLSYFVGTFIGSWVAARLSAEAPLRQGYLIGLLLLVASVMNLKEVPHPLWFIVGNIVVVLVGALIGARWGVRKASTTAPTQA